MVDFARRRWRRLLVQCWLWLLEWRLWLWGIQALAIGKGWQMQWWWPVEPRRRWQRWLRLLEQLRTPLRC